MSKVDFSSALSMLLNNLVSTRRGSKQLFSIGVDSALVVIALWSAYSLRLGELFTDFQYTWFYFVIMPIVTTLIFGSLGIYRWVIRSSNSKLFSQLFKASLLSGVCLLILMFFLPSEQSNPRSLFLIFALVLTGLSIFVRVVWKNIFEVEARGERIAIYGAGTHGRNLANIFNFNHIYQPVVFIDDDSRLASTTLCGLKVLKGDDLNLKLKLKRLDVRRLVLAMPAMSAFEYERKLSSVEKLGHPVLTMPSIDELIAGASPGEVRDVSIQDILGRGEVAPDLDLMARRVVDRTVLITGAGGSIGSELCRQVFALKPKHLIVLDNSEANLYHITEEIQAKIKRRSSPSTMTFLPYLGSVTDESRIQELFKQYDIDTVFHAAAYKHVPIVEAQPDQGVETNVFGTLNVLNATVNNAVSDFVLISTDKAVRPTNAMGATKRVAELILQSYAAKKHRTRISMVRFGNVLGSSGSVVPKFQKQIAAGGPVTLTHTEVTRYFMTIPEAAQLVLQASAIAKGGDVFVLDMGEPVRIEQLAITMVKLYGKQLHRETGNPTDIKIEVEGLRPGEKMYEELFINDSHRQTEVTKIFTAEESWMPWAVLSPRLEQLRLAAASRDRVAIKAQLISLAFLNAEKENGRTSHAKEEIISGRDTTKVAELSTASSL